MNALRSKTSRCDDLREQSPRTRLSFEAGMHQLAALHIFLIQLFPARAWRARQDAAQVFSRICYVLIFRTFGRASSSASRGTRACVITASPMKYTLANLAPSILHRAPRADPRRDGGWIGDSNNVCIPGLQAAPVDFKLHSRPPASGTRWKPTRS